MLFLFLLIKSEKEKSEGRPRGSSNHFEGGVGF